MEKRYIVPRERLENLIIDSGFLQALELAGVENWEGYSYAMEIYNSAEETSVQDALDTFQELPE